MLLQKIKYPIYQKNDIFFENVYIKIFMDKTVKVYGWDMFIMFKSSANKLST